MDLSNIASTYSNAQASAGAASANSLQSTLRNISADSSEEELKGAIRDFESYFVEQMLKEVRKNIKIDKDEEEDSTMSQYKDLFMDQTIELAADKLVDEFGENLTQQLYEQMKRNYGIE